MFIHNSAGSSTKEIAMEMKEVSKEDLKNSSETSVACPKLSSQHILTGMVRQIKIFTL